MISTSCRIIKYFYFVFSFRSRLFLVSFLPCHLSVAEPMSDTEWIRTSVNICFRPNGISRWEMSSSLGPSRRWSAVFKVARRSIRRWHRRLVERTSSRQYSATHSLYYCPTPRHLSCKHRLSPYILFLTLTSSQVLSHLNF